MPAVLPAGNLGLTFGVTCVTLCMQTVFSILAPKPYAAAVCGENAACRAGHGSHFESWPLLQ